MNHTNVQNAAKLYEQQHVSDKSPEITPVRTSNPFSVLGNMDTADLEVFEDSQILGLNVGRGQKRNRISTGGKSGNSGHDIAPSEFCNLSVVITLLYVNMPLFCTFFFIFSFVPVSYPMANSEIFTNSQSYSSSNKINSYVEFHS
jgi:hypothetical protein